MKKGNMSLAVRLLFSLFVAAVGAVLVLLRLEGMPGLLISNVGLAFIVAGFVSCFHEVIIKRLEGDETVSSVADEVLKRIREETPFTATGIRSVADVRKHYQGYYAWTTANCPQELFFAGRSVLHRIDADFKTRNLGSAAEQIARRLSEGANIKILFIDPTSDLIPRLAKEEGQKTEELLTDVHTSLEICESLYSALKLKSFPSRARLEIRVFNQIPYFAYHKVDDDVIIGFYFSEEKGYTSAAYQVVDVQTKQFFESHFDSILVNAKRLVWVDPRRGKTEMDDDLINKLRAACRKSGPGQRTASEVS